MTSWFKFLKVFEDVVDILDPELNLGSEEEDEGDEEGNEERKDEVQEEDDQFPDMTAHNHDTQDEMG